MEPSEEGFAQFVHVLEIRFSYLASLEEERVRIANSPREILTAPLIKLK